MKGAKDSVIWVLFNYDCYFLTRRQDWHNKFQLNTTYLVVARRFPEGEKKAECTALLWLTVLIGSGLSTTIFLKSHIQALLSLELVAMMLVLCALKSMLLILPSCKLNKDDDFPVVSSQTLTVPCASPKYKDFTSSGLWDKEQILWSP